MTHLNARSLFLLAALCFTLLLSGKGANATPISVTISSASGPNSTDTISFSVSFGYNGDFDHYQVVYSITEVIEWLDADGNWHTVYVPVSTTNSNDIQGTHPQWNTNGTVMFDGAAQAQHVLDTTPAAVFVRYSYQITATVTRRSDQKNLGTVTIRTDKPVVINRPIIVPTIPKRIQLPDDFPIYDLPLFNLLLTD